MLRVSILAGAILKFIKVHIHVAQTQFIWNSQSSKAWYYYLQNAGMERAKKIVFWKCSPLCQALRARSAILGELFWAVCIYIHKTSFRMAYSGGLCFSADPFLMNRHLLGHYVSGSVAKQSTLLFGRTQSRLRWQINRKVPKNERENYNVVR